MLTAYVIGMLGVALLAALWVAIQVAWRRRFPEAASDDPDALAGRVGCHGCEDAAICGARPAAGPGGGEIP